MMVFGRKRVKAVFVIITLLILIIATLLFNNYRYNNLIDAYAVRIAQQEQQVKGLEKENEILNVALKKMGEFIQSQRNTNTIEAEAEKKEETDSDTREISQGMSWGVPLLVGTLEVVRQTITNVLKFSWR